MGMFDYIRCELPLPDGWESDELQTKDFDCQMVTHVITKDGRLMLDNGHYEEVPLLERRNWKVEWGTSVEAQKEHIVETTAGRIRRVPKMEDANFYGIVNFYGLELEVAKGRPFYVGHNYNAKFTDGQLAEITLATA